MDNNLHTAAICPDVVRTSGALRRRVVCHASCHPLGFFHLRRKKRAAADTDDGGDAGTRSAIPSPRLRPDSFVRGKMIPGCLLWCHIYLWNQTLQLYHISPARSPDTLLEGYESALWDGMSQTPLFGGERSFPARTFAVHLKTGISSGYSEVSVIRQTRKSDVSLQLILFQSGVDAILENQALERLHTFCRIVWMKGS